MTIRKKLKRPIQQEIFNRIEYDPFVERLSKYSFKVYLPKHWVRILIEHMEDPDNIYFFKVDGTGTKSPHNNILIRSYVDITLTEGHEEYKAMMLL